MADKWTFKWKITFILWHLIMLIVICIYYLISILQWCHLVVPCYREEKNRCTDMVTSIHQGNEEFVTKSDMRQGFCLNLSLSPLLLYWKTWVFYGNIPRTLFYPTLLDLLSGLWKWNELQEERFQKLRMKTLLEAPAV